MSKMKVRLHHGLPSRTNAIKLAHAIVPTIKEGLPMFRECHQKKWNGRSYEFSLALGQFKISGHVYVTSLDVEVYVDMPHQMVNLRKVLQEKFQEFMKMVFPKATAYA